ncbi:TetR/AcrR family transcriptional regulator [Cohnella cellulosilytica]|uniref:TetR/AcrR family transcriptional regulator C-terminal domain-containing protein n=1 Tax=Cohnella cellulosilytica TaxID=986710 RepID=A0ABW2FER2_9BACL
MVKKTDRRQIRTKQLLRQALLECIEEKGIDHVTVTDVAERANLNRGTFYLHYRDVPDMLDTLMNERFEQVFSLVRLLDPRELSQYAFAGEPYPKVLAIFEEVLRNADFFKVMLGPKGELSYAMQFRNLMSSHLFSKLEYIMPEGAPTLVPREYLVAYMTAANFGMVLHWIQNGFRETPYQMALIATQLVNHGPIVSSGIRTVPRIEAPNDAPGS